MEQANAAIQEGSKGHMRRSEIDVLLEMVPHEVFCIDKAMQATIEELGDGAEIQRDKARNIFHSLRSLGRTAELRYSWPS